MPKVWLLAAAVTGGVAGYWAGRLGCLLLSVLRRGALPPRGCCEASVAVLWSSVGARTAEGLPWWWIPVPLLLGWLAVVLTVCDVLTLRLPDALTLPALPVAAVALAWAAYWSHRPDLLRGALLGSVLFAGAYAAISLASPAALGPGDVKLAGTLGAAVGAVSVPMVALCMAVAAVFTLVQSLWVRGHGVPHGPAMLAPAWLATALAPGFAAVGG